MGDKGIPTEQPAEEGSDNDQQQPIREPKFMPRNIARKLNLNRIIINISG